MVTLMFLASGVPVVVIRFGRGPASLSVFHMHRRICAGVLEELKIKAFVCVCVCHCVCECARATCQRRVV